MQFIAIKTRALIPPKDDIYNILDESVKEVKEKDIIFITSKILAIHQGRCLPIDSVPNKDNLIKQEADYYIDRNMVPGEYAILTIKENILIASSGIDESNAKGHYILWPKNTDKLLLEIRNYLFKKHRINELGVVSVDSQTTPLRWGTRGIVTALVGVNPLFDYRGKEDIFGREMKITISNIIDGLGATAVLLMGEGKEQIPIVIARGYKKAEFGEQYSTKDLMIPFEVDIYKPLLNEFFKKSTKN